MLSRCFSQDSYTNGKISQKAVRMVDEMDFDKGIAEKYLAEYGELVIKIGVNLQPDQLLVINSPVTCAALARAIGAAAYRAGAHDVTLLYSDELFSRARFRLGRPEIFSEFPNGDGSFSLLRQKAARLLFQFPPETRRYSKASTRSGCKCRTWPPPRLWKSTGKGS